MLPDPNDPIFSNMEEVGKVFEPILQELYEFSAQHGFNWEGRYGSTGKIYNFRKRAGGVGCLWIDYVADTPARKESFCADAPAGNVFCIYGNWTYKDFKTSVCRFGNSKIYVRIPASPDEVRDALKKTYELLKSWKPEDIPEATGDLAAAWAERESEDDFIKGLMFDPLLD